MCKCSEMNKLEVQLKRIMDFAMESFQKSLETLSKSYDFLSTDG
jgi:hypothetical protein